MNFIQFQRLVEKHGSEEWVYEHMPLSVIAMYRRNKDMAYSDDDIIRLTKGNRKIANILNLQKKWFK